MIAVVLCFFVLWLSFTANVNENSWEFGVLRAVGLDVNRFHLFVILLSIRVIRMYIYEALCLIISSVLIGAIIGELELFDFIFNFMVGMMVSITLTSNFLSPLDLFKLDLRCPFVRMNISAFHHSSSGRANKAFILWNWKKP